LNSKENDVEEACEKPNCDKSVGREETREGCITMNQIQKMIEECTTMNFGRK
jgi:hypothetical protein